jgi:cellulose synthase/poly-beta-1,6-N-acetylglucosamine synthase-like glycosyltransferase
MESVHIAWIVVGSCLALLTLPGSFELALLTIAGLFPTRRRVRVDVGITRRRPTAIVVPAHDEEAGIAQCVASLFACEMGDEPFTVLVVADNCSDKTADAARAAGAEVLVRFDPERRGKGYALELAFDHLGSRGFEILAVVDADTTVAPSFVREIRCAVAAGADAVQVRYVVSNASASVRTRLAHIAWLAFNVLRLRGRATCGFSVGILGNGFALTRATIEAVPYRARSVVEDLEYHLMLVRAGRRVDFVETSEVSAAAPTNTKAMSSQRARWEGGRMRVARDTIPALFRNVLAGRWRLLEPLLELALLPLSMHVGLLMVTVAMPWTASRAYACIGLAIVAVHVLAALVVGRASARDWLALLAAPGYVAWKLALMPAIARASKKSASWVRTEREVEPAPADRWRSAG